MNSRSKQVDSQKVMVEFLMQDANRIFQSNKIILLSVWLSFYGLSKESNFKTNGRRRWKFKYGRRVHRRDGDQGKVAISLL